MMAFVLKVCLRTVVYAVMMHTLQNISLVATRLCLKSYWKPGQGENKNERFSTELYTNHLQVDCFVAAC